MTDVKSLPGIFDFFTPRPSKLRFEYNCHTVCQGINKNMYKLVYDATKNLTFPYLDYVSILVILFANLIYIKKRKTYYTGCLSKKLTTAISYRCRFLQFFIPFFLFLAFSIFSLQAYIDTKSFFRVKSVIEDKNYKSISGNITNFTPMPYSGHSFESFDVDNISFKYSDYSGTNYFFKQTKSHGGPILGNGQHVKINYISIYYTDCLPFVQYFGIKCPKQTNNKIIKLWIYE